MIVERSLISHSSSREEERVIIVYMEVTKAKTVLDELKVKKRVQLRKKYKHCLSSSSLRLKDEQKSKIQTFIRAEGIDFASTSFPITGKTPFTR